MPQRSAPSLMFEASERLETSATTPYPATVDPLIAENMVSVLAQLLDPAQVTLQLPHNAENLPSGLLARLAEAGYGLQIVSADQGAHLLRFRQQRDTSVPQALVLDVSLAADEIELMRRYVDTGKMVPLGPMHVSGSRTRPVLDDRIFGEQVASDTLVSNVVWQAGEADTSLAPRIDLLSATRRAAIEPLGNAPSPTALNHERVEVNNLFYGQGSSFEDIWKDYERIKVETVIFANDSLRLGEHGKAQLLQLAERFDARTDLFGLVGCSNGPTALDIGNEGLALGRARRVSEELQYIGIARSQILDEGCWSAESSDVEFPKRGVVVEHWRRRS